MKSEFVFDRTKLQIFVEDWNDTRYFVCVEYEGHNIHMGMTLCDFIEDCEYWDFNDVEAEKRNDGTFGFLFSKDYKKEVIIAQITSFIYQYPFCCEWKWKK